MKLNPLEVLNLKLDATTAEINRQFRDLSLLVHPDKCREDFRMEAQKAFSVLNEAKAELLDENKRAAMVQMIQEAKTTVQKRREKLIKDAHKREVREQKLRDKAAGMKETPPAAAPPMRDVTKDTGFEEEAKGELRELLIAREWRKRQLLKQAAATDVVAAKEKEELDQKRKDKKEFEEEWEKNRDTRVSSWRTFQKYGKKRSYKMPKALEEDDNTRYIKRLRSKKAEEEKEADHK